MPWSEFFQIIIAVVIGAHIYSVGRVGATVFQPVNALIERTTAMFSRRNDNHQPRQDVTPTLRS